MEYIVNGLQENVAQKEPTEQKEPEKPEHNNHARKGRDTRDYSIKVTIQNMEEIKKCAWRHNSDANGTIIRKHAQITSREMDIQSIEDLTCLIDKHTVHTKGDQEPIETMDAQAMKSLQAANRKYMIHKLRCDGRATSKDRDVFIVMIKVMDVWNVVAPDGSLYPCNMTYACFGTLSDLWVPILGFFTSISIVSYLVSAIGVTGMITMGLAARMIGTRALYEKMKTLKADTWVSTVKKFIEESTLSFDVFHKAKAAFIRALSDIGGLYMYWNKQRCIQYDNTLNIPPGLQSFVTTGVTLAQQLRTYLESLIVWFGTFYLLKNTSILRHYNKYNNNKKMLAIAVVVGIGMLPSMLSVSGTGAYMAWKLPYKWLPSMVTIGSEAGSKRDLVAGTFNSRLWAPRPAYPDYQVGGGHSVTGRRRRSVRRRRVGTRRTRCRGGGARMNMRRRTPSHKRSHKRPRGRFASSTHPHIPH